MNPETLGLNRIIRDLEDRAAVLTHENMQLRAEIRRLRHELERR